MPSQRLLETLEQLQAELAETAAVDQQTRQALEEVTSAVRRQVEQPAEAHDDDSLGSQLRDFMLGLETEHPHLTRAVNQVAGALANLGI